MDAKLPNKKIMSPAGGLGHKQADGFPIIACLFVPIFKSYALVEYKTKKEFLWTH
ncbi:hypothetical protein KUL17_41250 [Alteromonas sp. KUL17]|nr:hypothetical protein KUL17_41250 [Alteromonas sp. KUL17]